MTVDDWPEKCIAHEICGDDEVSQEHRRQAGSVLAGTKTSRTLSQLYRAAAFADARHPGTLPIGLLGSKNDFVIRAGRVAV